MARSTRPIQTPARARARASTCRRHPSRPWTTTHHTYGNHMTDHTLTIEHFDAEPDQRRDARPRTSMPLVVWILAAGTFLMGTTEFMIAGLLPDISRDLGVGVSHGGLLITAFAVGMILGAPAMSLATLRISRAWTLRLALAVFAIGHVA